MESSSFTITELALDSFTARGATLVPSLPSQHRSLPGAGTSTCVTIQAPGYSLNTTPGEEGSSAVNHTICTSAPLLMLYVRGWNKHSGHCSVLLAFVCLWQDRTTSCLWRSPTESKTSHQLIRFFIDYKYTYKLCWTASLKDEQSSTDHEKILPTLMLTCQLMHLRSYKPWGKARWLGIRVLMFIKQSLKISSRLLLQMSKHYTGINPVFRQPSQETHPHSNKQ